MKKVLCSLVVLAILVGMFVCMGVQTFASEDPETAVFAVSDAELSVDSIGEMKTQAPDCLIVDVNGLAEEQAGTGYSVVWRAEDPMIMTDVAYIWPDFAQMFYVGPESKLVVLVGVGAESTAESIQNAVTGYLGEEEPYVIAVGPKEAASAVALCADMVDMFMTCGVAEEETEDTVSSLGSVKLENVGSDEEAPVCHVVLKEDEVTAEAIPVPAGSAVTDPGPGVGGSGPIMPVPEDEPDEPVMYSITFDGAGAAGSMDAVSVEEGTMWFFPNVYVEGMGGFTYDGYNFTGWSLNGDNLNHQPGDDITVTGDSVVTAQWELIPVQNVTISYVAGEGAYGAQIDESYAPGTVITLQPWPADFSKEGCEMTGWNIDGQHYDVSSAYTIEGNVTATAEWIEIPVEVKNATVTFSAGEAAGQAGNDNITQPVNDIGEGVSFGLPECTFTYEGHKFTGWKAEDGTDTLYTPAAGQGVEYFLTGDMTFTAQWEAVQQEEEQPEVFTVTYASGVETATGSMEPVQVKKGESHQLLPCGFAVEGQKFTGWLVNNEVKQPEVDSITVEEDVTITAQWTPITYTVTYKANGGTGNDVILQGLSKDQVIVLQAGDSFTAPAGQKFVAWTVEGGDGTARYAAGSNFAVTGDVVLLAVWEPQTGLDAGLTSAAPLTYTQGSDTEPSMSFANAQIATVSLDSTQLIAGQQYALSNENKTLTMNGDFLDQQSTGTHTITVSFQNGANGESYEQKTSSINIAPPTVAQTTGDHVFSSEWNRAADWAKTFENSAPVKFEIYFGTNNGVENYQAGQNTDYTISGNTLTLHPTMVNGTWGSEWPNGTYRFRVTLANGEEWTLQLTVSGTAVSTIANNPSSSPEPPAQGGAPVTGDDFELVLVIVITVVLVVALAVVLIILMKRRSAGGSGRH